MSFALVVAATITLVVGLLQSGLTLIYVSIACSVLAGLVLAVAVLRGRPEEAPAAARAGAGPVPAGGPTPGPLARPWDTGSTAAAGAEASPSTVPSWRSEEPGAAPAAATADTEKAAEPEPEYAGVLARRPWASDRTQQMSPIPEDDDEDEAGAEPAEVEEDAPFPIAGYETLRASEILRRLPDLSPGDLERVRRREVDGMNRFTVLSRIDAQLETATPATGDWDIGDAEWEPAATDQPAPARRSTRRPPAAKTAKAAPAARKAPARKAPVKASPEPAPAAKRAPAKKAASTAKAASTGRVRSPLQQAIEARRAAEAAGTGAAPAASRGARAAKAAPAKAAPAKAVPAKRAATPAKAAPAAATPAKKAAAPAKKAAAAPVPAGKRAPARKAAGPAKAPMTATEAVAAAKARVADKTAAKKVSRPRKSAG